ncbi:MAG: hypothetical protein K0R38_1513 [Polyangiaceae bacterium]|nr:hypothetical protein [Polyangiaceae bacterium]
MSLSRATLKHRPTPTQLLARVLEAPHLAHQVQSLPGPVLAKLIEEVGLQDAGELVALATTQQLAEVLDEDLWRSEKPGEDAVFDSERFLVWLEVLAEAGERFVAERLAELPEDLVTLAFHRHVLVLPLADLRAELGREDDEAEAAEKALASCLSEELEDFQLIWRGGDGWDDVLGALLALDRDHHSIAVNLLERCAHLSRAHIDDHGGLYEVLTADEMLESDLSAEREARRTERGFVTPSAAAGFLRLALRGADETPFTEHDPLTRGYFRDLSRQPTPAPVAASSALVGLLADAGVIEERAVPRLSDWASRSEPLIIGALRVLAERSPHLFAERSEELAYLSNVLVAGASVDGRRLRPVEAVAHAIDGVSAGLALAAGAHEPSAELAADVLARHPCDGLLRLAYAQARSPGRKAGPESLQRVRALLKTLKV